MVARAGSRGRPSRARRRPRDDELLVAVEVVGVNYRDVYEREGRGAAYGRAPVPRIIGAEGAGTVLRGAGEFAEGNRVAWAAADGSYAEQAAVPVAQAVKVPDGTSSELDGEADLGALMYQRPLRALLSSA